VNYLQQTIRLALAFALITSSNPVFAAGFKIRSSRLPNNMPVGARSIIQPQILNLDLSLPPEHSGINPLVKIVHSISAITTPKQEQQHPTIIGNLQGIARKQKNTSKQNSLTSISAFSEDFDGIEPSENATPQDQEISEEDISTKRDENPLDLWFKRDVDKSITASETYATIKIIKGSGSEWYWNKYSENTLVLIRVGGRMKFASRIIEAETKPINKLTRKDFKGYFSEKYMKGKTLSSLRSKVLKELKLSSEKSSNPVIVTPNTPVRLLKFMPLIVAANLPENNPEPILEPRPRADLEIPEKLKKLGDFMPKMVLVDLRLFGDSIPFDLLEDMGKLMKAGVFFTFISDKTQEEVDKMIVRGITLKQRDDVVRYKLFSLSHNGSRLYGYSGSFSGYLDGKYFSHTENDALEYAMRAEGADEIISNTREEFIIAAHKKTDPAQFEGEVKKILDSYLPDNTFSYEMSESEGQPTLRVRPTSLASSIPGFLETLRNEKDLYLNPSDMLVISEDKELLMATAGSVQPSKYSNLRGPELVDMSYAAMLGEYRENKPLDLAASASSINSFKFDRNGLGGFQYSIYMLMGHVIHASFNWAVWKYRNEGVLPPVERVFDVAKKMWKREDASSTGNLLPDSHATMSDFFLTMDHRLKSMYAYLATMLEEYPIVIGTELPNITVINRFKQDVFLHRDILRFIFDLVVAKKTADGLEVQIVDFKTGQTTVLGLLKKDTQVNFYDFVVDRIWKTLTTPYGVLGKVNKVADFKVSFILPSSIYEPQLAFWDSRLMFENFLRKIMISMRNHKLGKPKKASKKKKPKKKSAKKKKTESPKKK